MHLLRSEVWFLFLFDWPYFRTKIFVVDSYNRSISATSKTEINRIKIWKLKLQHTQYHWSILWGKGVITRNFPQAVYNLFYKFVLKESFVLYKMYLFNGGSGCVKTCIKLKNIFLCFKFFVGHIQVFFL